MVWNRLRGKGGRASFRYGGVEVVKLLLDRGAAVIDGDGRGNTALIAACESDARCREKCY